MGAQANIYVVIMAGGVGSRFWPRSRERSPKQLMEIVGGRTMIQDAVGRLNGFVSPGENFRRDEQAAKTSVIKQLPDIPVENIIIEPVGRNAARVSDWPQCWCVTG